MSPPLFVMACPTSRYQALSQIRLSSAGAGLAEAERRRDRTLAAR